MSHTKFRFRSLHNKMRAISLTITALGARVRSQSEMMLYAFPHTILQSISIEISSHFHPANISVSSFEASFGSFSSILNILKYFYINLNII